ncbi:MAG: hypothetical protein HY814_13760, partial [Candidatus Riflebacteria bacterium]|nr:hypothetical protein [Candidatus Riflebacteria bacterium]
MGVSFCMEFVKAGHLDRRSLPKPTSLWAEPIPLQVDDDEQEDFRTLLESDLDCSYHRWFNR